MKFLSEVDNAAALAAEVAQKDKSDFESFGHNRLESAFVDRVFVVYECLGRDSKNVQRPPRIVTTIRVVDFRAHYSTGCEVKLLDESTQRTMVVSHIPARVFDYAIFMAVPARIMLKWDAQMLAGRLVRSLLFAVLIKARNKAEFFSKGNFYMETPNRLRELFPHVHFDLET